MNTTSLKTENSISGPADELPAQMQNLGRQARRAARLLAMASSSQKNHALAQMKTHVLADMPIILAANAKDVAAGKKRGLTASFIDRLALDESRVSAMADGIEAIAALPDPVGDVMAAWDRPNGLKISRVRVPLGIIGIIYESRPNVTADAGALCLKSGNAVILRGGSDSYYTSRAIVQALHKGLSDASLPGHAVQMVPSIDRAAVGLMLAGLDGNLDVIVPRGGKGLVARVEREARVPVFSHLEGICHVYVDEAAETDKARDIVLNAKMRRTGICGAAETLLLDRAGLAVHGRAIIRSLLDAGCEVRGEAEIQALDSRVVAAVAEDWTTEYLDAIISAKVVDGVFDAIAHIDMYSSHHTEAIVTEDADAAQAFLAQVDSAIVLHNASTQFADGGEFGMGAEIGIATGKMHARGPVGLEQLTSFKYQVRGTGQVRPN